jgi:anti-sigma-K factor RskA
MSQETHVIELLPEYALGCLDEDDEILVSEHVATCSVCRAELEAFENVTDRLVFAAPETAPPVRLKQQLMNRIQPPMEPATAGPQQLSWWQKLAALLQQSAPVWGAASLVLVLILAVNNLMLRNQAHEPVLTSGGMRIVALASTDAASSAAGTLVISADGEYGSLAVDGLPPLGNAQQYQLWLIKDGERTDGGVFSVNPEGYGVLWIESAAPLSSFSAFGITVEPAGGSSGPTGEKVLGGSL